MTTEFNKALLNHQREMAYMDINFRVDSTGYNRTEEANEVMKAKCKRDYDAWVSCLEGLSQSVDTNTVQSTPQA